MHEMALAEGIIELVEDTARREQAQRVCLVVIEIGELAAVEPEALAFCFDAVSHGGVANGARLQIERAPGVGWCLPCGTSVPLTELYGACPRCGSHQVQPTGGTEMRVKEIEIE
jgi:hydrogenase nickel incorporation protein HypA/HybF